MNNLTHTAALTEPGTMTESGTITESSTMTEPEPLSSSAESPRPKPALKLFVPLLIVTFIPMLGLPLLFSFDIHFDHIPLIGWAIFFGGVGHVASTVFFYGDRESYPIMNGMKPRFYALPLIVIGMTLLTLLFKDAIALSKTFVASMFFIHLCWLHFHYQKQNYGLVALAAANSKERMPKPFLIVIMMPVLAGGLAVIPQLLSAVVQIDTLLTPYYQGVLFILSLRCYLLLISSPIRDCLNAHSLPFSVLQALPFFCPLYL